MKILAITNLYPPHYLGGYELICRTVVNGLRSRGHSVPVITSDHVVPSAAHLPDDPAVERNLRIHGLYGHPWLSMRDLPVLEWHNNTLLRSALARHRPDVVHVWNMGGLSKSMLFTLQKLNVPTVYYMSDHWLARAAQGDVWSSWWNRSGVSWKHACLRAFWTRIGVRRRRDQSSPTNPLRHLELRRIYFCSRALRDLTVAAGYSVGHGAVIYCPVDVERFNSPPRPPSHPVRRLLYAGRLAEDKDVMTALRALAQLNGTFRGSFSIYGRGDSGYIEQLAGFAREHRLPVHFATAQPDDMPAIYKEHDALLFTSKWDEPFALTPLEAMASGLPVIGTTTGGSAELFRNGENALTYQPGNAGELAGRILQLSSDAALRSRCAEAGYCEVRRRCSATVVVDQVESYLEESLRTWQPVTLPRYDS